jgi:hypothetical protein
MPAGESGRRRRDRLELGAGRDRLDAERRRELVEAFLAGYGQAVEDFGAYANRQTRTVPSRRWWTLLHHRDRADSG